MKKYYSHIHRQIFSIVAFLSLVSFASIAQLPGPPLQAIADSLQKLLDKGRTTEASNGAVLAVLKPGKWSWAGASGKSSVSPDTVAQPGITFRLASISKTFTMVVMMQLVENGTLSLSDTITKWLRLSLVDTVPNGRDMTVKQLLQHSSGVGNYTANSSFSSVWNSNPNKVWTPEELVWYGAQKGASFLPGKGWSYSNTGFVLLAMIVESATGKSYQENIQTRIIDFLALKHTYYPPGTKIPESHMVSNDHHGSTFIGAGEMISNTEDLNIYHEAIYQKKFFGQAMLDSINTWVNTTSPPYWYYSLGYMKYNYSQAVVMGHGGNLPLTSSGMYYNSQCDFYMSFDFNKSTLNGLNSLIFPVKAYMCSLLTGVKEELENIVINKMRTYPNPAQGEFYLELNEMIEDGLQLTITDLSGKSVYHEKMNIDSPVFIKAYSFPDLPAGIYAIKVSGNKETFFSKVLIAK